MNPVSSEQRVNFWTPEQQRELLWLCAIFLGMVVLAKATFYRESLRFLFPFVAKLFLIFVFPGYTLLLFQRETIGLSRRIALGIGINLGLLLTLSYTLGMVGIHLRYHHLIIPLPITILGLTLFAYRARLSRFAIFRTYTMVKKEKVRRE